MQSVFLTFTSTEIVLTTCVKQGRVPGGSEVVRFLTTSNYTCDYDGVIP